MTVLGRHVGAGVVVIVDEQIDPRTLAPVAHGMTDAVVEVIDVAGLHDQFLAANLLLDPGRDDERHVQPVGAMGHDLAIDMGWDDRAWLEPDQG